MIFTKNIFGQYLFLKKWLIKIIGFISYRRFRKTLKISGSENINNLPAKNVLFVSNHQTYFADVVAMFHVFNAGLSGRVDSIKNIGYLWKPKLNIYFVAGSPYQKEDSLYDDYDGENAAGENCEMTIILKLSVACHTFYLFGVDDVAAMIIRCHFL